MYTKFREEFKDMVRRPVPGRYVGLVHLKVVRESQSLYGPGEITGPKEAVEMVRPLLAEADREMVVVLSLSVRMRPQAAEIAAVGGTAQCPIDLRSIFKHALLNNAVHILCFHNHPSGDPSPSSEDFLVTERIREAGELLGVSLVDHIIIGEDRFYSFKEQGILKDVVPGEAENSQKAVPRREGVSCR